jgi:hypothetical protein
MCVKSSLPCAGLTSQLVSVLSERRIADGGEKQSPDIARASERASDSDKDRETESDSEKDSDRGSANGRGLDRHQLRFGTRGGIGLVQERGLAAC